MRIVCGILCVILILFAGVQYNDPDFTFWGAIYGIGALWTGFGALSPSTIRWRPAQIMLVVCLAACVYGVVHFFPTTDRWWMQDVWWETETAREGMGMMVVLVALVSAALVGMRRV